MSEKQKQSGTAPGISGQEPVQDDTTILSSSDTSTDQGLSGADLRGALDAARKDSAKYRTQLRDTQDRLERLESELSKRDKAAEQARREKLEQQGQFKELAEANERKAQEAQQQLNARTQAMQARLLKSELNARLVAKGFKPEQVEFLAPAISGKLEVEWGEDFTPTADFDAAITSAVEAFGLDKQAEAKASEERKATLNPNVATLATQVPGPSNVSGDDDFNAAFARDMQGALSG